MIDIHSEDIELLAWDALNAARANIQDAIEQPNDDVAGIFFSGVKGQQILSILQEYIRFELSFNKVQSMNYKIEFPDYDDTIIVPEGWLDDSWHNDVCPKITKDKLVIWCDYKDPAHRESEGQQFIVSMNIDEAYEPLHQFDTFADALMFCQKVQA